MKVQPEKSDSKKVSLLLIYSTSADIVMNEYAGSDFVMNECTSADI